MAKTTVALLAVAVTAAVLTATPAAAARRPAPVKANAKHAAVQQATVKPAVTQPAVTQPVVSSTTTSTARSAAHARAMWLWSGADPAAAVAWAGSQGVRDIFVSVPWAPTAADLARLKDLRARTRVAGIRLSALGGDPAWALDPASAVAWRTRASATGLFDGIHLDVEPYLLPEWRTGQAGVVAGYLAMLSAVRAAGPEPLEADVPFWLATVPAGAGNLADAVIARVDAITVMSYRDTAAGVLDVGADLLARGQTARMPVRLAAETQPLADCGYCTFALSTRTALAAQLSTVDAQAAAYGTYNGVAVHDYDSWTRLSG